MRKLPVFFLLDCSESMVGENRKKLEDGLESVTSILKRDPHALESVYISVIAFAGIAKTIVNLTEIVLFYSPKLPIGSGTKLGAALDELMHQIDAEVVKTTVDQKGDWKPIVFLITDGKPTDDTSIAVEKWNKSYKTKAHLIAIAVGKYADVKPLEKFADDVLIFENNNENDFKQFILWMSASIVSHSKSVGENTNADLIANIDENILKKNEATNYSNKVDLDCAVLTGRCQKQKKLYLMKYDCSDVDLTYELNGCYPIEDDYFKWSDTSQLSTKISTSELFGVPSCPYCGAASAFAMCECGNLMCTNGEGEAICPWCEKEVVFSFASEHESGGFNVNRGRG